MAEAYEPLSPETLGSRLGGIAALKSKIGEDAENWSVEEVGDGNLNLVFIVNGSNGAVVVKQALPYVRLVGESWPLPLTRTFFEYHALIRQAERDPGRAPEVYHFDETQALVVMEFLSPHVILRKQMMAGRTVKHLGSTIGAFCARTAFRGSDLCMAAPRKKADVALFAGNVDLCDITENLVFTDPYFDAEMNRHTSPQLDHAVAGLRSDVQLKIEAQHMKRGFTAKMETMCHGDLHTGSIMVTDDDARVIDPEFAFYGPMGFDVGMLISNYLMAYLAMPGHLDGQTCRDYQHWLLDVTTQTWSSFAEEFGRLWHTERTGILYPKTLYEDQDQPVASEAALQQVLAEIFRDAIGIAGIEMHRRILGLAHIAEYDTIEDADLRARLEARGLELGRMLVLSRHHMADVEAVVSAARFVGKESA